MTPRASLGNTDQLICIVSYSTEMTGMCLPAFFNPIYAPTFAVQGYVKAKRVCKRRPRTRCLSVKLSAASFNSSDDGRLVLTEGDIVAVVRGSGAIRAELGVVTGTDSSGKNVDFAPLKPLVPELYVQDGSDTTFVRSSKVRRVPSTWVSEQNGWIVLDSDVVQAEEAISRAVEVPTVVVNTAPPPKPMSNIPKRELFRPTRAQALIGAALSIPIAAGAYAVFASERASFAGEGKAQLTDLALIVPASLSVLSLIVGASLAIYAFNLADDEK